MIQTYGAGRFLIGEREWRRPVLVTPTEAWPWEVARAEEIEAANLAPLLAAVPPPEIVVLGCGARSVFIPPARRAALKALGLALEVVDTGAACRLYNVLVAESRRVAAALIPL